jgi:hypothetical protein
MVSTQIAPILGQLQLLRTALTLLASSSEEQLDHLAALGIPDAVDELALEFDDAAPLVPQLVAAKAITTEAEHAIHLLDQRLTSMSGREHSQLWTRSALKTAPQWTEIRALARRALDQLAA